MVLSQDLAPRACRGTFAATTSRQPTEGSQTMHSFVLPPAITRMLPSLYGGAIDASSPISARLFVCPICNGTRHFVDIAAPEVSAQSDNPHHHPARHHHPPHHSSTSLIHTPLHLSVLNFPSHVRPQTLPTKAMLHRAVDLHHGRQTFR